MERSKAGAVGSNNSSGNYLRNLRVSLSAPGSLLSPCSDFESCNFTHTRPTTAHCAKVRLPLRLQDPDAAQFSFKSWNDLLFRFFSSPVLILSICVIETEKQTVQASMCLAES